MRTLRGSSISLILIIAVMLVVLALALRMAYFATKLLPMTIAVLVLILAVIELARGIKAGNGSGAPATAGKGKGRTDPPVSKDLLYLSWVVGFFLAVYVLGFLIATPIFVGAYMKRHGSNWLASVATAIIYTCIIYVVFDFALQANLYEGRLPIWLNSLSG